jgi:hypothetical protein
MAAGTICETGETGETGENTVVAALFDPTIDEKRSALYQFCSIESRYPASQQIEFLTGLTGLPPFPPSLRESGF